MNIRLSGDLIVGSTAEAEVEAMAMLNRFKPASNFVLLIVPSRYFCGGYICFMSWFLKHFVLLAPYVCFHIFSHVKVTEWPPIGKIAAHSAYEVFPDIST